MIVFSRRISLHRVNLLGIVILIALISILFGAFGESASQTLRMEKIWVKKGEAPNAWFGQSVAGVGDVNGDGCDDFAITAYGTGKVYLFWGGAELDTVPDVVFTNLGFWVSGTGDVNNDGYNDILTSNDADYSRGIVRLFLGGPIVDTIPDWKVEGKFDPEMFGTDVRIIRDVNGDGYDDILIYSTFAYYQKLWGKVSLYLGGNNIDTVAAWTLIGDENHRIWAISSAGDVNGDGYGDILVGLPGTSWTDPSGEARIYLGGVELDTIPDIILSEKKGQPEQYSEFGESVACAGDVNGDGYDDVIIVNPRYDVRGRAYLYFGGAQMDSIADVIIDPPRASWEDIERGTGVGDVGGDGYDDVAILIQSGWGVIGICLGKKYMDGLIDLAVSGEYGSYEYGFSISWADVNNDGYDDIIVGDRWYDFYKEDFRGRVFIYAGNSTLSGFKDFSSEVGAPKYFQLYQNYPNPFNRQTLIKYQISGITNQRVSLKVYDIQGKEVRTLVDRTEKPGEYRIIWDARDKNGKEVSSGIYFYQLRVGISEKTKKMVIVK